MTQPRTLPSSDLQTLLRLFQARRFDAMEQLARSLLQQHPDAGMAWKALGVALQAQGQDAVDALQKAVGLLPGDTELAASLVEAHLSQGHALMKAGRAEDAAASYAAAQRLDPKHAQAHACRGVALQTLGQLDAAVRSLEAALALRPDLVHAQFCLGSSLLALGRADEALHSLRRVLELKPDHAHALANLGNALKALGRLDEALPAYRRAIELEPGLALNHANLGAASRELGQMQQALDCYQRVLDLEPGNLSARSDRLFILNYLTHDTGGMASTTGTEGTEGSEGSEGTDDTDDTDDTHSTEGTEGTTGPPLTRKAEAQRFGALATAQARPYVHRPGRTPRHSGERRRVGFVSADLREHPVGYFVESVMAALSTKHADEIELFVYANSEIDDALTARLRSHCRRWTSITRLDDEAAAALIHADNVDILVDLSGHTAGNRLPLFAWKPAPLQISWLGDCATTGLDAIDHFLADPWIAPPDADAEFTEKVWRLPETFLCFTPPQIDLAAGVLPARARGHITFGCFNKLNKLNDQVIATWARVLQALPHAKLLLKSGPLGMEASRQQLSRRFAAHGIARERLILEGATPRADYLRAYQRVDIALDPFPYPGGTTSVEALWMGVPVLTLAGSCALARQGVSVLRNVGLPDWIATDVDDYVERAVRHAGDTEALAAFRQDSRQDGSRQGLRQRLLASPLCDGDRFARHFVSALRELANR